MVAMAEESGLASSSVDLVVASQALHVLDTDAFYPEVRRLLKPGGVIAAWCYGDCLVGGPIEGELSRVRTELAGYWGPERDLVASGYSGIPFPFCEINIPPQCLRASWTLSDLLGHLRTWQGARAYEKSRGQEALERLLIGVAEVWGTPTVTREMAWPIRVRIGQA